MTQMSRRATILALGALPLAACGNGIGGDRGAKIDARVDATLSELFSKYPDTLNLRDNASAMLVMPLVTEAGLGFGGAYGRGALRIGTTTVDYYSAVKASVGPQIGAQQYASVLFFMTQEALAEFRSSSGWAAGADVEYAIPSAGKTLSTETTTALSPVIAFVFGNAGLRLGATLEGVKYSRILP
ncbi:MAG: YSC84-related protein [Paracoccaceae bacterium]